MNAPGRIREEESKIFDTTDKQETDYEMDARKVTELLRATIDPAQQKQAEEQLNQVGRLVEKRAQITDTWTDTCASARSFFLRYHSSLRNLRSNVRTCFSKMVPSR